MPVPTTPARVLLAGTIIVTVAPALAGEFGGFATPAQYMSGARAEGVAVADLDGDGRLDLAAVSQAGTITTFRGLPDGTFEPIGTFPTGQDPQSVALGDFDGDGSLDAVVAGADAGAVVTVHMNAGDGMLGAPASFGIGGPARSVEAADFDGDGLIDVVTGNHDTYDISILRGRGDGTFDPAVELPLDRRPWSIAVADMNADGRPDLLAATLDTMPPWDGDTLQVLINDGAGGFETPRQHAVLEAPVAVAAGDFNEDGILDAVVASNLGSVNVLRGTGDGTFTDRPGVFVNGRPSAVVTADMNRDGAVDFVVVDRYLDRANVAINNGSGGFLHPVFHGTGIDPVDVAAGDFDDDGDCDVVVANAATLGAAVSVLMNETPAIGCAQLQRLAIVTGELQFGGLTALFDMGSMVLIGSGPADTGTDGIGGETPVVQRMELEVTASIGSPRVSRLHVTVSASAPPQDVTGEVFLLNRRTNQFDRIGTFPAPQFGELVTIDDIPAAPYVAPERRSTSPYANAAGRVVLRLRHTAESPDVDLPFVSFVDLLRITFE